MSGKISTRCLVIFHAVALGVLSVVSKQLDAEERRLIPLGCVFKSGTWTNNLNSWILLTSARSTNLALAVSYNWRRPIAGERSRYTTFMIKSYAHA
ncbi:hypothetical protein EDB19DRAFT_1690799 [Suillus lakei]|nr:hypothetical protein EDB19DRAFT_1690799 [Suillus lakei]